MLAQRKGFADANSSFDDAVFIIFGVPFDKTCSFRPGTALAPDHVRTASYNFETYHLEHGVDILDVPIHDAGDIAEAGTTDEMLELVEENARRVAKAGKFPIVLGGEHSLSPGVVRGMGGGFAVITIDAHLDFRSEYLSNPNSHACATRRMGDIVGVERIVPVGIRSVCSEEKADQESLGLRFFTAADVKRDGIEQVIAKAVKAAGAEKIYLTVDIDGIDPAYAPGVGTPEPFGLTDLDVKRAIQLLAPMLVGFDLVEVCPPYDNGNTSALAARLVREAIVTVWKSRAGH